MKSSLFLAMSAVALALASCHNDDPTPQPTPVTKTINSTVQYISPATKGTRVAWPNRNEWDTKYAVPAEITLEEAHAVYQYFVDHSTDKQGETAVNYTNFFVQHVWKGTDTYPLEDMNHAKHQVTGGNQMDYLWAGNDDHVNNFNANPSNGIMCMENSSTAHFSYNDTYGTTGKEPGITSTRHDKYIILEVPGYGTYLGFDYETYKTSGERHEGDGVYTDWIIKISEAVAPTSSNPGSGDVYEDPFPEEKEVIPGTTGGHVEFDIHQQEHKDWNEIKTSVHIRDTVNCRILLPIPKDYQADPDDFAIRVAEEYEYIPTKVKLNDRTYEIQFAVGHTDQGIEITIGTATCANALKASRVLYDDGLTFEVHTYVKPEVTHEQVWAMLKKTTCPQTSMSLWTPGAPLWQSVEQDVITHIKGQITSAYFTEEKIAIEYTPKETK